MICDTYSFGPRASNRPGECCGLRRLSDVLPEVMARYDLHLVAEPQRELVLCLMVNTTLDTTAVAS